MVISHIHSAVWYPIIRLWQGVQCCDCMSRFSRLVRQCSADTGLMCSVATEQGVRSGVFASGSLSNACFDSDSTNRRILVTEFADDFFGGVQDALTRHYWLPQWSPLTEVSPLVPERYLPGADILQSQDQQLHSPDQWQPPRLSRLREPLSGNSLLSMDRARLVRHC